MPSPIPHCPHSRMRHALGRLLAGLAMVLLGAQVQAASQDPYTHFFNDTFYDFIEEAENAKDAGKKAIFIFFEMDECPFCHRMKTTVFNQPAVQAYFREHFLNIALDIEGDVEMVGFDGEDTTQKAWAFQEHRVRATPVMAFFDLSGQRIARITGAVSGPEEFLWFGEYIVSGAYEKRPWIRYKRSRKQNARSG